jgi:hypothetical protein
MNLFRVPAALRQKVAAFCVRLSKSAVNDFRFVLHWSSLECLDQMIARVCTFKRLIRDTVFKRDLNRHVFDCVLRALSLVNQK